MEKTSINLVILSPSSEVNKLTFSSISTATTVGELRERISAAVVTHPVPGRQRLIYRGHALLDANRTLKDIFTQEIVVLPRNIESSETLSLHLVLPPESALPSATSLTPLNVPNPSQRTRSPQHAHSHPNNTGTGQHHHQSVQHPSMQASISQNNVIQAQLPADPGQAQQVHLHGPHPNTQFPPQLQQAFAQFQAVNQQLAAQLAAVAANSGHQGVGTNQAQGPVVQQAPFMQQPLQHMFAQHQQQQQQQQLRTVSEPTTSGTIPQQPSRAGTPAVQSDHQSTGRASTPRNTNTIVRENRGPNGERWQMVIQSGQVNINPNHSGLDHPNPPNLQSNPSIARNGLSALQDTPMLHSPIASSALLHFQSNLSAMEAAMAGGNPLPDSVFEQARETLMRIPNMAQEGRSSMNTRLDALIERSNNLRQTLNSHLTRAAQERIAAQRSTQGAQSSAVYVLSSPSGPQALLVSPTDLYAAPWQLPSLSFVSPPSFVHHHSPAYSSQTSTANLQNPMVVQQSPSSAGQAHQPFPQNTDGAPAEQLRPQEQQQQQQQQQQQVNQARDILRILLPLGGNLWLLVRLFGFVYFFTAGAGWRRTVLLCLVASFVFIAQTGVFRPVLQAIWDPIRRHAEGLVPLAGNEPRRPGAERNGEIANVMATQRTNQGPTPQEAAERLLQERERRDLSILRQGVRRVERAIALFVASLVPGVGERHIAAREAAEAARQAEARERDEQARREEAATRPSEEGGESLSQSAGADGHSNNTGEANEEPLASGQDQNPPPPLIEV